MSDCHKTYLKSNSGLSPSGLVGECKLHDRMEDDKDEEGVNIEEEEE